MVAKRIIPCLDVKNGQVVKGVQFKNHQIVGDIIERAVAYCNDGADEVVFYDITASCEQRTVAPTWVTDVARMLNIPFCVAGGISTIKQAETVLNAGADKVSINSPALLNPNLINELAKQFGSQCVVVGIDSFTTPDDKYHVYQYTGDAVRSQNTGRLTLDWLREVQDRGAGEIVLNCMNQDGQRRGYDLLQLQRLGPYCKIPLIASGGAGSEEDFLRLFQHTHVDGALAASVFHNNSIAIPTLKNYLLSHNCEVRLL